MMQMAAKLAGIPTARPAIAFELRAGVSLAASLVAVSKVGADVISDAVVVVAGSV
jgi:hypothetical protein